MLRLKAQTEGVLERSTCSHATEKGQSGELINSCIRTGVLAVAMFALVVLPVSAKPDPVRAFVYASDEAVEPSMSSVAGGSYPLIALQAPPNSGDIATIRSFSGHYQQGNGNRSDFAQVATWYPSGLTLPSLQQCTKGARAPNNGAAGYGQGRESLAVTAVAAFKTHLSMDSTPIELSVGPFHYRIPRNYIVSMDDWRGGPQTAAIVTLQAAFPGAKPYTEETKRCFVEPLASRPLGCILIEFYLEISPVYVTDQTFFNSRELFRNKEPKKGPFGFDLYEIGPDDARLEAYIKKTPEHTVVADCILSNDLHHKRNGVCESSTRTKSGLFIAYRFYLTELGSAEDIDRGLRNLIDSFAISESNK